MSALAHDFGSNSKLTTTLEDFLKNLESIEPLFDALSSVVFFIKNTEARYVFVNQTLVNRCGLKDKSALIGKTSEEVFLIPSEKYIHRKTCKLFAAVKS